MTKEGLVASAAVPHLSARLSVQPTGEGEEVALTLALSIERGWKLFGDDTALGIPITLDAGPVALSALHIPEGELRGRTVVTARAASWEADSVVRLGYQLCSNEICERPQVLALAFAV